MGFSADIEIGELRRHQYRDDSTASRASFARRDDLGYNFRLVGGMVTAIRERKQ